MSSGGSYDASAVESEMYRFWEAGGYFRARVNPAKKPYVIDIPLPNVTGALHLGHAVNDTLQDILIRHARMQGFEALWMPGTDHAGIATQAVVERKLKEEQNLTRHELGREGLVKKIWEWKEDYGGRILTQLRKMGLSCDWERTRFTLDEVCAKAVYEAFFQWFKAGLIYRGLRLVNWDAFLQTAVADDEIVHETVKGHLWHYRYPILDVAAGAPAGRGISDDAVRAALARAAAADAQPGRDYLTIATTRPETMLGDTAVAVHPDDERYRHLIGKHVLLPLQNRAIPVIADGILVKREFGTGCVKVTPGHDPNDYAFSQRHPEAKAINILTPDGKINENGGAYKDLDRYVARKKVVEDLEKLGLMEKIEPYETEIGHSDRSKTPIEPMLSEQWFVKMGDVAETAMEAVRDGRIQFFPARYARTFLDWLGEKRDWCISRQLWWGHRIPVWSIRLGVSKLGGVFGQRQDFLRPTRNLAIRVANDQGESFAIDVAGGEEAFLTQFARLLDRQDAVGEPHVTVVVCFRDEPDRSNDPVLAPLVRWMKRVGFARDPDVLDTWFSSGLWPISTLGWPDDYGKARRDEGTQARSDAAAAAPCVPACLRASVPTDLGYFFPTTVLVTGREIITLWVARMAVFSLYFTGRVPFQHVYIHPNIQDGQGRRMSKSLGNGVDPLDIIALYGTDALRFTMAQMATETQDVRLPVKPVQLPVGGAGAPAGQFRTVISSEKFELGRNFCNKVWQAATGFVLPNLDARRHEGTEARRHEGTDAGVTSPHSHVPTFPRPLTPDDLELEDRWILSRLAACIADVDRRYERYQISEMAGRLYDFFWSDFCDWYVELVKPRLYAPGGQPRDMNVAAREPRDSSRAPSGTVARQVLAFVLDQSLRLLHPVIPFVTEAIWKLLNEVTPNRGLRNVQPAEKALIAAAWPDVSVLTRDASVEREMEALQDVIKALRDTLVRINTSRSAAKMPAIGKLPQALIQADEELATGLRNQHMVLERLGRCDAVTIGSALTKPAESATKVLPGVEVYVPLSGLMDLKLERQRLVKERDELSGHIGRLESKLGNEGFVAKAPAAVVEQERARLAEMQGRLAALARNLEDLD